LLFVFLQVFSRASLAAVWVQDPSFLKDQLGLWVHKQQRRVLEALWPQLLQEAAAGGTQQRKKGGSKRKKSSGKSRS
jgi:hypothetical protein